MNGTRELPYGLRTETIIPDTTTGSLCLRNASMAMGPCVVGEFTNQETDSTFYPLDQPLFPTLTSSTLNMTDMAACVNQVSLWDVHLAVHPENTLIALLAKFPRVHSFRLYTTGPATLLMWVRDLAVVANGGARFEHLTLKRLKEAAELDETEQRSLVSSMRDVLPRASSLCISLLDPVMTAVVNEVFPLCSQCTCLQADFHSFSSLSGFIESATFANLRQWNPWFGFQLDDAHVVRVSQAVRNSTALRIAAGSLAWDARLVDACLRNPGMTRIEFSLGENLLDINSVMEILKSLDPGDGRSIDVSHPDLTDWRLLLILISRPSLLRNHMWAEYTVSGQLTADAIAGVLRNSKCALREIRLRFVDQGRKQISTVEAALQACTSVNSLWVSGVKKSDSPLQVFSGFLQNCPFLKSIQFQSPEDTSLFLDRIAQNRVVEHFSVRFPGSSKGEWVFCGHIGRRNLCSSLGSCRFLWLWWVCQWQFKDFDAVVAWDVLEMAEMNWAEVCRLEYQASMEQMAEEWTAEYRARLGEKCCSM